MVLKVLPVLPPDLRPLVSIEGGRFATSDLNDLYRRVINRNNRTKRLLELKAPEVIIRNEMRMLQESVDALLDNGRRGRVLTGANKLPLHSLSDMIKGKQGRFRQNLLGKRVDYSGRSVIVVGPSLKLHQCGLPKEMALELFKPFVLGHLKRRGLAISIKSAKLLVEQRIPETWDILEDVVQEYPILLNRAPTLYRLSIQAFEPVLVDGKAIQLHPLVCKAFNANFDGDQMAVHIPLSIEAQMEARVLMMSSNNIFSPVNGMPLIVPSEEMVLGLYFMTNSRHKARGEGMVFANINEVQRAYGNNVVDLQALVEVRFLKFMPSEEKKSKNKEVQTYDHVKTTVGRALLSQVLPASLPFELVNRCLTEKTISQLINLCYHRVGLNETLIFAEKLMYYGFTYATRAGITLGIEDMVIPTQKPSLIDEAKVLIEEIQGQYRSGLISFGQRYNQIIDIWTTVNNKMAQAVLEQLSGNNTTQPPPLSSASAMESKDEPLNTERKTSFPENALYMMIDAGVRSLIQIHQLAGMRGLMTKPDGSIIETPITANFREGLDTHQYFISTHGTRKGLADMALKTANAGYLTRRLVDVAQDVIIVEPDCGTSQGLTLTALIKDDQVLESLSARVLGRVVAEDVFISKPKTKKRKPVIKAGTLLDEAWLEHLEDLGIDHIKVRSMITCQSQSSVCAMCYGHDLARGQLVNIGEAVGVIAAQSIGESGTQLTMRTHHTGGVAKRAVVANHIESNSTGIVEFHDIRLIRRKIKKRGRLSRKNFQFVTVAQNGEISIIDDSGKERERHKVPYGAIVSVSDGDILPAGQRVASWEPHIYPIITEFAGYIRFVDIREGITVNREIDKNTGLSTIIVKEPKQRPAHAKNLRPMLKLVDKRNNDLTFADSEPPVVYILPPHAIINVEDGARVNIGDILARIPHDSPKLRDITNGLLRVIDLFEARVSKEPAILALRAGTVSFGKETKTKHRCIITDEDGQMDEFPIPKWRQINVSAGQQVKVGDVIVDGYQNPHDILRLNGINYLVKYLVNAMQEIYITHGVKINDKHFEVIIRQMLRTVTIVAPGDTPFLGGEVVLFPRLLEENQRVAEQAGEPATWKQNLLGITKASLATESFISAASFMDTARVLLASAVSGKCDELRGLKENVIIGRLIPAGTGFVYHKDRQW
jgi:DNA-directed RNA polymerase subunit beta'